MKTEREREREREVKREGKVVLLGHMSENVVGWVGLLRLLLDLSVRICIDEGPDQTPVDGPSRMAKRWRSLKEYTKATQKKGRGSRRREGNKKKTKAKDQFHFFKFCNTGRRVR